MCDLHSKFEEDRTKSGVAIVNHTYFGQTHRHVHTDRQQTYTEVILHWTDKKRMTIMMTTISDLAMGEGELLPALLVT